MIIHKRVYKHAGKEMKVLTGGHKNLIFIPENYYDRIYGSSIWRGLTNLARNFLSRWKGSMDNEIVVGYLKNDKTKTTQIFHTSELELIIGNYEEPKLKKEK